MDCPQDLPQAIECLLFAAGEALPVERLAELCQVSTETVLHGLAELQKLLDDRGLQVLRGPDGYTLATRPEYAEYLARLREPPKERLSAASLEVLAVVAYRQPVTKAEIDRVRGVDSSGPLHTLLEKRLITCVGRKDVPGRPMLYGTTEVFLKAFGLSSLADLPQLPGDFARQARQLSLDDRAPVTSQSASGAQGSASDEVGA
ncbi:MAG: SMC-Scp complex subunit ScpB [Armatimonadetes bacterium]|nr:SMC-Scp complex subunit ScpB [Armatimonadota bacterium]